MAPRVGCECTAPWGHGDLGAVAGRCPPLSHGPSLRAVARKAHFLMAALTASVLASRCAADRDRRLPGDHSFLAEGGRLLSRKGRRDPWATPGWPTALALLHPHPRSPRSRFRPRLRDSEPGGPDGPWPQTSPTFLVLLFGNHSHCHGAGELGLPTMRQAGHLH